MSSKLGKILLVRLDRIGDLVLTLPVGESLRKIDPEAEIRWWIPKGLGFVASASTPPSTYREVDLRFNLGRVHALLGELRRDRPNLAIVFHAPWWVGLLLFMARVPVRGGPRSQWHHFLFLNQGVRQKRSDAKSHELEYNFQLAEKSLNLGPKRLQRSPLQLKPPSNEAMRLFGLEERGYTVVHPGMGGSALNWPLPMYVQLISKLTEETRVVITGTKADEPYLKPVRDKLAGNARVTWLDGALNGSELIMTLKNARAVVAPSTGVLHLAASTGAPTVGLFSPVKVQAATRWGPLGAHAKALTPEVVCPARFQCLGEKCAHFDCMRMVTVDQVLETLSALDQRR